MILLQTCLIFLFFFSLTAEARSSARMVNTAGGGRSLIKLTLPAMTPAAAMGGCPFYAIDFALNEIRRLRPQGPFAQSAFPLALAIPPLPEELALIQRLEAIFSPLDPAAPKEVEAGGDRRMADRVEGTK
jgi:hypothetical protein